MYEFEVIISFLQFYNIFYPVSVHYLAQFEC